MTLTRYDHEKGCFVLAGSTKKYKCQCHPDSPFHWKDNPQPSMFFNDQFFRASKTGQSVSQASTAQVEKARAEGTMAGFLRGVSKNREEEILRIRNFTTFSLAANTDAKRKDTSDQMPTVRSLDKRTGVKDGRKDKRNVPKT